MRTQRNCSICGQCINCSQEYHTILNRYGSLQPTILCYKYYPKGPKKPNIRACDHQNLQWTLTESFSIQCIYQDWWENKSKYKNEDEE